MRVRNGFNSFGVGEEIGLQLQRHETNHAHEASLMIFNESKTRVASNMKTPELTTKEKELLASLESLIRKSVWSVGAREYNGPYESEGKWIEYPLRLPGKIDSHDKYIHIKLKSEDTTKDFVDSHCAFGNSHLHTSKAVYRILWELKRRSLLNVEGFSQPWL